MSKKRHALSTGEAATALMVMLENGDGTPNIDAKKIRALVAAGLLTNVSDGKRVRIPRSEVRALGSSTRYVDDPSSLGDVVYRVSVIARRRNEVHTPDGVLLRSHAGVDYSLDLPADEAALGFDSAWSVSEQVCDRLVDSQALLLATCKGFVGRGHVRRIIGWTDLADTPRRGLLTEADPDIDELVGDGIWVDVPADGHENSLLVDRS